jgi:hypothetical protein
VRPESLDRRSTFARLLRYAELTGAYNPLRFLAQSNRIKLIKESEFSKICFCKTDSRGANLKKTPGRSK